MGDAIKQQLADSCKCFISRRHRATRTACCFADPATRLVTGQEKLTVPGIQLLQAMRQCFMTLIELRAHSGRGPRYGVQHILIKKHLSAGKFLPRIPYAPIGDLAGPGYKICPRLELLELFAND